MFDSNTLSNIAVFPFKISPLTATHSLHPKVAQNSNWGHPRELLLCQWLHSSQHPRWPEIIFHQGWFSLSASTVMCEQRGWLSPLCHDSPASASLSWQNVQGHCHAEGTNCVSLGIEVKPKSLPMSSPLCVCRIHSSRFFLWTQILCGSPHL